ncbi:MAG: DUF5615 family PIN-like protein [Cyanobacteria bacterium J06629_19]
MRLIVRSQRTTLEMTDFYSDENFPIDAVRVLRQFGHDVLTSYEAGQANQGIPDDDVLAYAVRYARTVITLNRKDFIQIHRSGVEHNGIVICKDDRDYQGQMRSLHQHLSSLNDLNNRLLRVKKQNQSDAGVQVFVVQEYNRE